MKNNTKVSKEISLGSEPPFTVSMQITLFQDWEINLTSDKLDHPVTGGAYFFNNAKKQLERELIRIVRKELRKLISVYRYSKYQLDYLESRETLGQLEKLLSSFNTRTKLQRVQDLIEYNLDLIEIVLPGESARSYPSQLRKINFLRDILLFNLDSIVEPGRADNKPTEL
jgi:hypothetical protein